jgi:thiamine biosynthesis lipoprotein
MGTVVNLTLVGLDRDAADAAAEAAFARMHELEGLLSRHLPNSEVSRLNREGRVESASPALVRVLQVADGVSRLGDGAFDITVEPVLRLYRDVLSTRHELPGVHEIDEALRFVGYPAVTVDGDRVSFQRQGMAVTLDGVAKGYVVDEAVATLRRRGFENVLVEAGGDLVAGGEKSPGRPWRVGIRNPRAAGEIQTRVDARNCAVTTSGDYMQPFTPDLAEHHIIDPRMGHSPAELASATVVAPDAATADALSTLAMVLGRRRARRVIEDLPGCEACFVSKRLETTTTSGFSCT